jgi:hypothetical protein
MGLKQASKLSRAVESYLKNNGIISVCVKFRLISRGKRWGGGGVCGKVFFCNYVNLSDQPYCCKTNHNTSTTLQS